MDIPFQASEAVVTDPGGILSRAVRPSKAFPESAEAVRFAVRGHIERANANFAKLKNRLVTKYGNKRVVNLKEASKEMLVLTNERFPKGMRTFKEVRKDALQVISDARRFPGTINNSIKIDQGITRQMQFRPSKVQTAKADAAFNDLMGEFKEILKGKVEKGIKSKAYTRATEGLSAAKQLQRDAAPLLSGKDLPRAMETAERRGSLDLTTLQRIRGAMKGTEKAIGELEKQVAGQYFRRPLNYAAGTVFGRGAQIGGPLERVISPSGLTAAPGTAINLFAPKRFLEENP